MFGFLTVSLSFGVYVVNSTYFLTKKDNNINQVYFCFAITT